MVFVSRAHPLVRRQFRLRPTGHHIVGGAAPESELTPKTVKVQTFTDKRTETTKKKRTADPKRGLPHPPNTGLSDDQGLPQVGSEKALLREARP